MQKACAVLLFVLSVPLSADDGCLVPRVAFDVGSSKTAVRAAIVDRCLQKVNRAIRPENPGEWSRKVSYKESLDRTRSGPEDSVLTFPNEIQQAGIRALSELKESVLEAMKEYSAVEIRAVATSAFRLARSADEERGRSSLNEFLMRVEKETGVKLVVIAQKQEGELGFLAATNAVPVTVPVEDLVVWDIGGSSQQITIYNEKRFDVYQNEILASVSMKQTILEKFFPEDRLERTVLPSGTRSPNPMGEQAAERAVEYASQAVQDVPAHIRERLRRGFVAGTGGVHSVSVLRQIPAGSEFYTPGVLEKALEKNARLSDDELVEESVRLSRETSEEAKKRVAESTRQYSDTDVSNLALVLGVMKELEIPRVYPIQADIGDGVLLDERLWR